jgi:hypothetical protein
MSPGWALGVTTASALVLLLGVALKSRHQIRDELESYVSGYNRAEATGRFEDRYDARVATSFLLLALVLQAAAMTSGPTDLTLSPWIITRQAGFTVGGALLAWWLPRGLLVRRDVGLLEAAITERWKRQDEAKARRRGRV